MRSLSNLFSIASIATLGCGLALAQNGAPGSMIRADGAMTSSPGLTSLSHEMDAANGDDWDEHHKAINRYDVLPNGDLANGKRRADLMDQPG